MIKQRFIYVQHALLERVKICIHDKIHGAAKALPTSKNFLLHDISLVAILAE